MINYKDLSQIPEKTIKFFNVKELLDLHGKELKLSLIGKSVNSQITSVDLHRPGLALTGFFGDYAYEHIQLLGHTEWNYLNSIGEDNRRQSFSRLYNYKSPVWILTHGLEPHKELIEMCESTNTPLVVTELPTVDFARPLQKYLENHFARKAVLHGSMVDIFGVGVIFIGDSGVGKSECVMDLVERGHCLVTDDAIDLRRIGSIIFGKGMQDCNHFIEIRGIGIVNVRSMLGVKAVRAEKRLDIILELKKWDKDEQFDRTGLNGIKNKLLGVENIPHVIIPVIPGKNIAVVSEVVAMDFLLRREGEDSAKDLDNIVKAKILQKMEAKKQCL